jgi:hypothetical protein
MTTTSASRADLLMLSAVLATCGDCAGERLFVPVDDAGPGGEFCCTACDAAVFLLTTTPRVLRRDSHQVAS